MFSLRQTIYEALQKPTLYAEARTLIRLHIQFCDVGSDLTLRAPVMTAADDIHKYMYFFIVFQRK